MKKVEFTEAVVVASVETDLIKSGSDSLSCHEKGIRTHYNGDTLTDLINSDEISTETLIRSLLVELAREIDNLAGNRVIATENGEFEKATIISSKRTEMVDRAIKAIMAKKEFEANTSIDVESPSMRIVFQYFLEKCQESFAKAGMNSEISDTFFRNFNDICGSSWKKELKRRIAEIKS